jgi:hypothetical protein
MLPVFTRDRFVWQPPGIPAAGGQPQPTPEPGNTIARVNPHCLKKVASAMPHKITADTWVYTVITNPGPGEQLLGQHDADADIAYIPIFLEKEQASQGLLQLKVAQGTRCEVQAVLSSEIERPAGENGFLVYLLDASGNILEKLAPTIQKQ